MHMDRHESEIVALRDADAHLNQRVKKLEQPAAEQLINNRLNAKNGDDNLHFLHETNTYSFWPRKEEQGKPESSPHTLLMEE